MDETQPRSPSGTGPISPGMDERVRPKRLCDAVESAFGEIDVCAVDGDGLAVEIVGDAEPKDGDDP